MFKTHTIGRLLFEGAGVEGGAGGMGGGGGDPAPTMSEVVAGAISGEPGAEPVKPQEGEQPNAEEEKELAALEAEIRTKNPAMRGNIAIHRHQAVLTRTRNQQAKAVAEWEAKSKAWAEAEAKYKQETEGWRNYEWAKDPDIQHALKAIALADTDEKEFVNRLLQDERYAKLIQLKDQKAVPSDRPRPNQKNGEFEYYDDDGIEQLLNWHGGVVEKSVAEKVMSQVKQEYGPLADAYKATTTWNSALAEQKTVLEQMRTDWPGFKENEKEIKALMVAREEERKANPQLAPLPVHEAYQRIVIPKQQAEIKRLSESQQANEKTLREKLIAEMKTKPGAAATLKPGGGVERGEQTGERSLADVVRASLPRE